MIGDKNRIWIFFYNEVAKGKFHYFQQISYSCQKKKKSRRHAFINSRTIGGQPADHLETSPWLSRPGLREAFVREHYCVTSDVPLNLFIFFSDSQLKVKKKKKKETDIGLSAELISHLLALTFSHANWKLLWRVINHEQLQANMSSLSFRASTILHPGCSGSPTILTTWGF